MNNKGFTLMEMLVTIVIIGLITVLTFPNLETIQKDNDMKMKDTYEQILKHYADAYVNDLIYICSTSKVQQFFQTEFSNLQMCKKDTSANRYEFILSEKGYEAVTRTIELSKDSTGRFATNYPELKSFFNLTIINLKKIYMDNFNESKLKYSKIEEKIFINISNKKTTTEIKLNVD